MNGWDMYLLNLVERARRGNRLGTRRKQSTEICETPPESLLMGSFEVPDVKAPKRRRNTKIVYEPAAALPVD